MRMCSIPQRHFCPHNYVWFVPKKAVGNFTESQDFCQNERVSVYLLKKLLGVAGMLILQFHMLYHLLVSWRSTTNTWNNEGSVTRKRVRSGCKIIFIKAGKNNIWNTPKTFVEYEQNQDLLPVLKSFKNYWE